MLAQHVGKLAGRSARLHAGQEAHPQNRDRLVILLRGARRDGKTADRRARPFPRLWCDQAWASFITRSTAVIEDIYWKNGMPIQFKLIEANFASDDWKRNPPGQIPWSRTVTRRVYTGPAPYQIASLD
jgi:hypothetical protein